MPAGPRALVARSRARCRASGPLGLGVALLPLLLALGPAPARAQATGTILGTVVSDSSGEPLAGVEVQVPGFPLRTLTDANGRFVLAGVPVGERTVHVQRLGYAPETAGPVVVREDRSIELRIALRTSAIQLPGVTAHGERVRLIEPEVNTTHQVVGGRELRALPVDRIDQVIDLSTGVSEGHFRGGRIGQEAVVVDGVEVKDAFGASSGLAGLELAPGSLEQVEVVTGGFGAEYGSALSGVVRYATRRGSTERWEGRAALSTDRWAPKAAAFGFTRLSLSGGGPLTPLGDGTTIFADLLAQGAWDADPRARGATCLGAGDADAALAQRISALASDPTASGLYCPYTSAALPHDRGDKAIAFLRLDRPLAAGLALTASVLGNRVQQELYTPAFKYDNLAQLGERTRSGLATLSLDWTRQRAGSARHLNARASAEEIGRYIGALDPATFQDGGRIAGFGLHDFRFFGEDAARAGATGVLPGYTSPGGAVGSPFGPAGEGLFFTRGTPQLADWSRLGSIGADLSAEALSASGMALRGGLSGRHYHVRSYERVEADVAGSPALQRDFSPATASGFVEARWHTEDGVTFEAGFRVDAFSSGIDVPPDSNGISFGSGWKTVALPRIGASMPLPGTKRETVVRFNYARVAQPPDFRFFLDTALGDSLRTSILRQGNPALGFEKGNAFELGASQLVGTHLALAVTAFRKDLTDLVSGRLRLPGQAAPTFTTSDFGHVQGFELEIRTDWPLLQLRAGYSLQKAVGVSSTALSDTAVDAGQTRTEYPLAFDRRHSIDLVALAGRAAGADRAWGAALTTSVQSGYPLDRLLAAGDAKNTTFANSVYLPWTADVGLRLQLDLGSLPGCRRCHWSLTADGRNLLGLDNIRALRNDSGLLAPPDSVFLAVESGVAVPDHVIPYESSRYSRLIDLNGDGLITPDEFRQARTAAVLDRLDPSLFYGEARQLRAGVELTF